MLDYTNEQLDSKQMHVNIARRLHSERKKAGFTLITLAEESGYAKPTIFSWEKGWKEGTGENNIPTLQQLLDLSKIYNCTPEYLLCEYDQKTMQLTDVCFETGLLPETIKKLKEPFTALLEQPMEQHGYFHILYQFINHIINNYQPLIDALYNRIIYENVSRRFESSGYKDLILEGFNAVSVDRKTEFAALTNRLSPNITAYFYAKAMEEYYRTKGIDDSEIAVIIHEFQNSFFTISPTGKAQADFTLTTCFMELVNSFLDSYPDNVDSYKNFVDDVRVNHSNEIKIKPLEIIR